MSELESSILENNLLWGIVFVLFIVLMVWLFIKWSEQNLKDRQREIEERKKVVNVFNNLNIGDSFNSVLNSFSELGLNLLLISEEKQNMNVYSCYKIPLWWVYSEGNIQTNSTGFNTNSYHGQTTNMNNGADINSGFTTGTMHMNSNSTLLRDASISLMFENNLLVSKGQQGLL